MLDAIRADVTAHGAQLLVVAIPAREQVHDADWQELQSGLGLAATGPRPQPAPAQAGRVERPHGHAPDGPAAADRRRRRRRRLYFHADPHWNAPARRWRHS